MTRRPRTTLALALAIAGPVLAGCAAGPYDAAYGPAWDAGYAAPVAYAPAPYAYGAPAYDAPPPRYEPARYDSRREREWDRRERRQAEERRYRERDRGYAESVRPGRAPTLEQRARRGEQPNQTGLWGGQIGTSGQ